MSGQWCKEFNVIEEVVDRLKARFMSFVEKDPSTDCWNWAGNILPNGYGKFSLFGSYVVAHRVSYSLFWGESIEAGLVVRHMCHNKKCVNPEHLQTGTQKENVQDSMDAGLVLKGDKHPWRVRPETVPQGVDRWNSVFTEEQVIAIREQYAAGSITHAEIAAAYGTSVSVVASLVRGYTYSKSGGPITSRGRGGNGVGRLMPARKKAS